MDLKENDLMRSEHKAWKELFAGFCKELNINNDEGNNRKYRPFFELIEKWSQESLKLRHYQHDIGKVNIYNDDLRIFKPKMEVNKNGCKNKDENFKN